MARPLRLQVPGGVYHVMSRGNAKQDTFLDRQDRRRFLAGLLLVTERFNVWCHAYCLMANHYHLLIETPDANLSPAIRHLNGVYAQSFNRRRDRVGHLFQGRFKSSLVEKDAHLFVVSRYIVLNPVMAGFVSRPEEWEWSSYRAQVGLSAPPPFLNVDWLLACFDRRDRQRAHMAYREFVAQGLDSCEEMDFGPIIGSSDFVSEFREMLSETAPVREIPREQRFAARPSLEDLFGGCNNREDRNFRIRRAYAEYGYTMKQIADHLGLHRMTISRAVRSDVAM